MPVELSFNFLDVALALQCLTDDGCGPLGFSLSLSEGFDDFLDRVAINKDGVESKSFKSGVINC